LPNNPTIIEAGCADGIDSLLFAKEFPKGTIVAVEPIPELFKKSMALVESHPNVHLYQLALSGKSDEVKIMFSGDQENIHHSASLLKPTKHFKHFPQIEFQRKLSVTTISLVDLMKKCNLDHVDLLWLDLQGLELEVLKNTQKEILSRIGVIHLEISRYPLYEGAHTYQEIKEFLLDSGFRLVKKRMPLVTGNAIFINTLATPQ
jgi:FkbM family methyltransferase